MSLIPFAVLVAEASFCLVLQPRFTKTPKWVAISIIVFHYAFWVFVFWPDTVTPLLPIHGLGLVFLLFPLPALLYIWQQGRLTSSSELTVASRTIIWGLLPAIAALAVAGITWMPARNIELSHPRDHSHRVVARAVSWVLSCIYVHSAWEWPGRICGSSTALAFRDQKIGYHRTRESFADLTIVGPGPVCGFRWPSLFLGL